MKKVISLFLSVAMLLSIVSVVDFSAYASVKTGKCGDNVTYSLDTETGVLTISGTGKMTDYSYSSSPFCNDTKIKVVTIDYGVTSIGKYAFRSCKNLTSVTMPNSLTSIGENSFDACIDLTSMIIPDSVKSIGEHAFYTCTSLKNVTIGNSLNMISNFVFVGCNSLENIMVDENNLNYSSIDGVLFNKKKTELILYPVGNSRNAYSIPNSVTSIGYYAFWGCTNLRNIKIPNNVESIGDYAFYNCTSLTSVTIPNSVTSIGNDAFYGCSSLTSVTIPNSVTSIGNNAFYGCSSLTSVTIPDSVTSIGYSALSSCTSLTSIEVSYDNENYSSVDGVLFDKDKTKLIQYPAGSNRTIYSIPNSVISIGSDAFVGCTSLTSVTIPNSVTSIGGSAFSGCTNLTSITIPDSVTSIGSYAFEDCTSLTSVTIGNSVTSIGGSAFSGCTNLTSITIPDSVTSIGSYAFEDCTSLTSVTIGNSVTSIGGSAFSGCTSLTSITIPDSVTSIGDYAFYECTSLKSVTIPDSVTSIGDYAFYECTSLKSVTIPNSVTSIGHNAFYGCYFTSENFVNNSNVEIDGYSRPTIVDTDDKGFCIKSNMLVKMRPVYAIGEVTIPNSITSIGWSAFYNCRNLTSVTIPNSVTSIVWSAFYNCRNLTSVTIPNSIESIGDNAFNGCSKLKKIEIPDSVTYIGSKAFYGTAFYNTVKNWEDGVLYCGNHLISAKSDVTKITVKASTVSIAAGALDNCKSLEKINVLNPKCVINCTIPKTAVIGGAEGSTAEEFAQKNNMSIDYFEECTHSDKVQVVIAATCTEQGAVQSRCADCDKLISQTFTAPLGHTMVITTPAKAPTCTTSGNTQAGYCTVCGYNEVSTVIPATGHNFVNNSANCLACGVANPNYVAPTQPTPSPTPSTTPTQPTPSPTPSTTPTQPNQNDTNTSNDENVTVISKPKSASIKKVKGAKKAVSVEWKKVSGVKGYQVQVATNKKFKKNKKTVTIKKQKTTKTTVKKLKAKKKYYVRVRTYKIVNGKKVYSSWSKVKTVKTK